MGLKGNYKANGLNQSERYIKIKPVVKVRMREAVEVYESKKARDNNQKLRTEYFALPSKVINDIEAYAVKKIYEYAKTDTKFSGLEDVFEVGQAGYVEPLTEEELNNLVDSELGEEPTEEPVEEPVEGEEPVEQA